MTAGTLVNGLLGAEPVPRVLRWLGYRALGLRVDTPNIFPGLRVAGRLRNVEIGAGTFLNRECFIEAVAEVRIGRDCQFGPQVAILTSHHPWTADGSVSKYPQGRSVRIGDRVWLGARTIVVPGVTLAPDVAVAAGAVVARDCLEPGLYAGVPARWVGPAKSADGADGARGVGS
ncbi:acyltransferase [Solihabitans fulvus]|uniref:Acyltransferase n=2 Tax=Solihabitans fulvus TaxID=1892852 RepID=A0A5B2XER1_9PSEU|nr:acyltransferase [Solihabitans fulvus]